MKLVYHGALCCGLKHIYGFSYDPNGTELEHTPESHGEEYPDCDGEGVDSDWEMPYGERPAEPRIERLKFLLEYLKKTRPSGIVEVCLARMPDDYAEDYAFTEMFDDSWSDDVKLEWCADQCDQRMWFPVLLDLGFKQVAEFENGNSGNVVHVFHLLMQEGEIVK